MENNNKSEFDKYKIGENFIQNFHEQFAINQNHYRSIFVQIILILVPILTAYGYLYLKIIETKFGLPIFYFLSAFLMLIGIILSTEIALLLVMSVSFRRDQYVTAKMREKVDILSKDAYTNYFPKSFMPNHAKRIFDWIPDYNLVLILSLISLKSGMFLTTILH